MIILTILYIILIDLKLIEHKNFKMEVQLNLKAILIISIIFLSFFVNLISQNIMWTKSYGLINTNDIANSVKQTDDNKYIVVGLTNSFGAGLYDVYLLRIDSNGDTLWTRTYGGIDDDRGSSIQITSDNGYIFTGYTNSFGAGSYDVYLIRTDSNGDTLWTKTYGGVDDDRGVEVQIISDGGYIITGWTESYGSGSYDVYLIRTDSNGDTLWTRFYGGSGEERGYSVQETSDNGFIIAGCTNSFGAGMNDIYLIRTDYNGDTLWTKTFGGSYHDWGYSIKNIIENGFILAGTTESFGAGYWDVYLLRIDSFGDTLWTKTYGGSSRDYGYSLQKVSDNGFVISGWTESFVACFCDVYLVRTDTNGDTLWTRTYGTVSYDRAHSINKTNDGGFILVGETWDLDYDDYNVYIIKTDSSGNTVDISEVSNKPDILSLSFFPVYYNNISINFSLPVGGNTILDIYDSSGRLVHRPISGYYSAGLHEINFTLNRNGIYFFRLNIDNIQKTGKFIVF